MMWSCCICHRRMTYNWSHICDECNPQTKKKPTAWPLWLCLIGAAVAVGVVWLS